MAKKTNPIVEQELIQTDPPQEEVVLQEQEPDTQEPDTQESEAPVMNATQAGYVPGSGKVSPGNCADYPVAFSQPFAEGTMPSVVVGLVSGSTAARFGTCACAVLDGSVTHEGFTIRFYNGDVSSRIPGFSYIAFGVVTQ